MTTTAPRPPKRSRRALVIVLVVVAALVLALVAGEIYVRKRVEACLADQLTSELGSPVDIDLSWKPVLLQSIDRRIPSVSLQSEDGRFGPAVGMNVSGTAEDVTLTDDPEAPGTIGSTHAEVEWGTDGILQTIQQQSFDGLVSGVNTDPEAGTLAFELVGGLVDLTVRPTADGGNVNVETVGAQVLGLGLPTDLVSGVVETITASLQSYPLGLEPTSIDVTDDALHVVLDGSEYALPPSQGDGSSSGGCSLGL
ncbi:DUF2993 domain-containing protein [Rhodococcus rhodnii]|uniref:DUF2993 domain-containing protein n=1 Tax=Rhodococcus rhodnii TaxID=38312 RepID=A0A6P2CM30_9NOCA|nr:DUF2993 domain-containing protein [Rhodococcus rhodnii]TXG92911.1 DUF2993 domain-containing protein [Rhodococcus rhodnii]